LNKNLILAGFAEEHKGAVAQYGDSRQWRFDKPTPARSKASGFQAKFLRAPKHFRHAESIAEAVTYLCWICADTVEAQQQDERDLTRVW
jgi:hypothetical protein